MTKTSNVNKGETAHDGPLIRSGQIQMNTETANTIRVWPRRAGWHFGFAGLSNCADGRGSVDGANGQRGSTTKSSQSDVTPCRKRKDQAEAADQSGVDTLCGDKLIMSGWT